MLHYYNNHKKLILILIATLFLTKRVFGNEVRITNESDFRTFLNSVNINGTNYLGTTVYLDYDLSLNDINESIGQTKNNYFLGTFDGQGHVISNLKIVSLTEYSGLFGYSTGITIKNIVIDSSCSIINYCSNSKYAYTGGIIGYCGSENSQSNIENSINMANVTFNGSLNNHGWFDQEYGSYLGGIVGCLQSNNNIFVKNCVNYGFIFHIGTCYDSYIGGIIGGSANSFVSSYKYVHNCLNYGEIINNRTFSNDLCIGGIAGMSKYIEFKNCLSAGKISYFSTQSKNNNIGNIIGKIDSSYNSKTDMYYCFYTNDLTYNMYGSGSPSIISNSPNSSTSVSVVVSHLNSQITKNNGWNKWLTNTNKASISFEINSKIFLTLTSQVILFPDLVDNSVLVFSGWYTDNSLTILFTSAEMFYDSTLYGIFCGSEITVTFDVNGGDNSSLTISTMAVGCNWLYGVLPTPTKIGYTFIGWFTKSDGGDKIESRDNITNQHNHTLYAQWKESNFTVYFDTNGGGIVENTSKIVLFNASYGYLPTPNKTGYSFSGWFLKNGTVINSSTVVLIPSDHTIYAHWSANNYTVYFDANGGVVTVESKVVTFNSPYGYLPTPNMTGHSFSGWFLKNGTEIIINSEDSVLIPYDHNVSAHWILNNYSVTFDFDNESLPVEKKYCFGENITYPDNPVKEGYTFNGWNNNISIVPAYNLYIKALWNINHYIITFNYTNETVINVTLNFNDKIVYPEDPEIEGFIFVKWDPSPEVVPAHNLIITAHLVENQNVEQGSANVIIGIAIPMLLIIIIAIILAIILFLNVRKRNSSENEGNRDINKPLIGSNVGRNSSSSGLLINGGSRDIPIDGCSRIIAFTRGEIEFKDNVKDITNIVFNIYPNNYVRPTMKNALLKAGIPEKKVNAICTACENAAHKALEEGNLFDGFTEEDAAAIAMYTYDFGGKDFENNPFRIINKSIIERDRNSLQKASGLLYLVMTALRKLPMVSGIPLYRGVKSEISIDESYYSKGNVIAWATLSSTSPDKNETIKLMSKKGKIPSGSLFIIECGWGYDISPYSLSQNVETEIILEPERKFMVNSVIHGEGLSYIKLDMLETPLLLPMRFGDGGNI